MQDTAKRLAETEAVEKRQRRVEAMNLQAIENNPLDAEDVAMFEMFEREDGKDGAMSAAAPSSLLRCRLRPSERRPLRLSSIPARKYCAIGSASRMSISSTGSKVVL